MLVIKRDGRKESVKFDKITARIEKLSYGLNTEFVKTIEIAKKVIDGLYDGVSTQELDELASETAATLTTKHPDFATLAARIAVSNLHKTTSKSFSSTIKDFTLMLTLRRVKMHLYFLRRYMVLLIKMQLFLILL